MKATTRCGVPLVALLALAGCTSTQDVLQPSALTSSDNGAAPEAAGITVTNPQPAATAVQEPQQQASLPPAPAPSARVFFAPVIGATEEAGALFSTRLRSSAPSGGLTLASADDGSASYMMRGYFSAISEGPQTTVIYVWDVLDPSGNRVHRIQGQERAPTGTGEGWAAVQPATMEAIADRTVQELSQWLAARQG